MAAAVEQSAFYSALWGSILTSPAVRLPGVTFVLLHLNRKLSMEDQLYVIGSDIELMVHDSTLQSRHPLSKHFMTELRAPELKIKFVYYTAFLQNSSLVNLIFLWFVV